MQLNFMGGRLIASHSFIWICLFISGPFYLYGLTLIPVWMSNHTHYKVWDEITYPFLNFRDVIGISLPLRTVLLVSIIDTKIKQLHMPYLRSNIAHNIARCKPNFKILFTRYTLRWQMFTAVGRYVMWRGNPDIWDNRKLASSWRYSTPGNKLLIKHSLNSETTTNSDMFYRKTLVIISPDGVSQDDRWTLGKFHHGGVYIVNSSMPSSAHMRQ